MQQAGKHPLGAIYTSETQLTRALAGEIRHAPRAVEQYFSKLLGHDLGELVDVGCEKDQRVDVMLSFATSVAETRVAIEAKVDHLLSDDQIERESQVAEYLVLLLLDAEDAGVFRDQVDGVITWAEIIGIFEDSRLLLSDVESIPAQKVQVERRLRCTLANLEIPAGWNLYIERGGASMPGITIVSPIHPNGSQLCGQIQVTGRSMPKLLDEVELEFYAGTRVCETEECFPKPESNIVPQWVSNARVLYESVLEKDPTKFNLKTRAPGTSRRPLGSRRKQLTKKYLPDQQWLAQGYIEWSLGVRAYPRPISEIDELAAETMKLFTSWFAALKNN